MGLLWRCNEANNSKFNLTPNDHRIQTPSPSVQKMARKLEPGRFVATDINSGKVLDLPLGNNQQPYAWGYHGKENQQVRTIFLTLSAERADRTSFKFLLSAVVTTDRLVVCYYFVLSVGLLPLRRGVHHQQRLQQWHVRHSPARRLEGTASGWKHASRHWAFPDVLGGGGSASETHGQAWRGIRAVREPVLLHDRADPLTWNFHLSATCSASGCRTQTELR